MKYQKFSHKTPHLPKKQHQLDPNLDLKQLVHHATVQYVDRDADGDVDVYDNPKRKTPDENPIGINVGMGSKKLLAKQKGELKHTRRGMAYEDLRKWFGTGGEGGVGGGGWDRYNTKGERIGKCAREPGEGKPKCLSKEKAAKMSKDEIATAVKRKREADPVADRQGKGGKPKMVSNKIEEQMGLVRYCPKCKKNETRSECAYGARYWDMFSMPPSIMTNQMKYDIAQLHPTNEEKDPCWTGYKQVGMKKKNGKEVPNCVPVSEADLTIDPQKHRQAQRAQKIRTLARQGSTEGERAAAERKTKGPKLFGEKVGLVDKILLELESEVISEKNVPTNPELWSKMKSRAKAKFDVYPSAYANGWAAKEYKKAGGSWKSVSEEVVLEEAVRIPAKTGNLMHVVLTWKGKMYSLKMFFPQISTPNRRDVQDQIEKIYPGSRVQSFNVSEYTPGEPFLQTEGAAWTKKEGQNKEGGLNEKGRKSYERENPGSDLKAPSKKVGNPRRASFCARMSGMKKKLTSSKTANDPNSRINKSLRAWNC